MPQILGRQLRRMSQTFGNLEEICRRYWVSRRDMPQILGK